MDRLDHEMTSFVQMSSVDERTGTIKTMEEKPYSAVAKGYTYFSENDVLFAKITPCMQNGKHAIARGLINGVGFGSTEFHVIRSSERVIPEWIHYFIRQPAYLEKAQKSFSGAVGQQRVPVSYLGDSVIPLPDLPTQRRIAAQLKERLDAVEVAKKAVEETQITTNQLTHTLLDNAFESVTSEVVRLGEVADKIGSGVTPRGGQDSYLSEGIPLIRSQNVHLNHFKREGLALISKEQDALMKETRVYPDDVLLNITGASIGRVCVVPGELCPANVNQHVCIIRAGDVFDPNYLSLWLSRPSFQKYIWGAQSGATRQALTKEMIENFQIPKPAIEVQRSITSSLMLVMHEAKRVSEVLDSQLDALNKLSTAYLCEAFDGDEINDEELNAPLRQSLAFCAKGNTFSV